MNGPAESSPVVKRFEEPRARFHDPYLVRKQDQVPLQLDLPSVEDDRYQRTWYRGVNAERAFARRLTFPPGGGTPIHAVTCDHVIVGLQGQADFEMRGEIFPVGAGDLLYFPANVLYAIRNRTDAEASFVSVGIEAAFGWPPRSDYWSEPGPAEGEGTADGS